MKFRLFFNCGAKTSDVQSTSRTAQQSTDIVVLNGTVMTQLKIGKKIPQNKSSDLTTVYANSSSLDSGSRNPSPTSDHHYADHGLLLCPHVEPKFIPIDSSFDLVGDDLFTADTNSNKQTPVFAEPLPEQTHCLFTSSELKPVHVAELNNQMLQLLKKQHNKNNKMNAWIETNADHDLFKEAELSGCTF